MPVFGSFYIEQVPSQTTLNQTMSYCGFPCHFEVNIHSPGFPGPVQTALSCLWNPIQNCFWLRIWLTSKEIRQCSCHTPPYSEMAIILEWVNFLLKAWKWYKLDAKPLRVWGADLQGVFLNGILWCSFFIAWIHWYSNQRGEVSVVLSPIQWVTYFPNFSICPK